MLGRSIFAFLTGIAVGVIVAGGLVFFLARQTATPAAAPGDPNAEYALALTLTEAFLSEQINNPPPPKADEPAPAPRRLQNATVRLLADGTMQVSGETSVLGLTVPVRAVILPRVVNQQLELTVIHAEAGALGVPTAIVTETEAAFNRQVRATTDRRDLQVIALLPSAGALTVRLK